MRKKFLSIILVFTFCFLFSTYVYAKDNNSVTNIKIQNENEKIEKINNIYTSNFLSYKNYSVISKEKIDKEFDCQINEVLDYLNNKNLKKNDNDVKPLDRDYYSSEIVAIKTGVSDYAYAGNQPRNGFYFPNGGSISWRDGSTPSLNVGVSVGGEYVSFNVGLGQAVSSGVVSANPNVPGPGTWKLLVAKEYEVRLVKIYRHQGNRKTLHMTMTPHVEIRTLFDFERF